MNPGPIVSNTDKCVVIHRFAGGKEDHYYPPETARRLAADLLKAADRIDGMPLLSLTPPGSTTTASFCR